MERIYKYKNSTLSVRFDDIVNSKADVIVSTDNNWLSMGGGLSLILRRKGGETIYDEAKKFRLANLGDVIVTGAGMLENKYIFHIVTIKRGLLPLSTTVDKAISYKTHQFIIENSINKCFALISALDLQSIAFPPIGTGSARIPYEEAALHMAKAISSNIEKTNKSLSVELYLFNRFQNKRNWEYISFFEKIGKYWPEETHQFKGCEIGASRRISDTTYETNSSFYDVFISYSRLDNEIVRTICEILKKDNISYWIDIEGKYSGENYKSTIVKKIEESTVVLFLSSKNSNESRNVRNEISIAISRNKKIIPIRLDANAYHPEIEYDLASTQHIDFESSDDFYKKVVDAVRGYMN